MLRELSYAAATYKVVVQSKCLLANQVLYFLDEMEAERHAMTKDEYVAIKKEFEGGKW